MEESTGKVGAFWLILTNKTKERTAHAVWKNGERCPLLFGTLRGGGPLASPFWKASFSAYSTDLYTAITEATEHQAEPKRGMQLIVCACYPRIFELAQQLANKTGGSGGVVFSGIPGIGKSWFLNYTLWRLLQQKKTVLGESVARNKVWLFKVQVASLSEKQIVEITQTVENDTDAWYLFDPCGDIPREPLEWNLSRSSRLLPIHNTKQFYKRTANNYYIPCRSWVELKKHVPHAAQTVAPGLRGV